MKKWFIASLALLLTTVLASGVWAKPAAKAKAVSAPAAKAATTAAPARKTAPVAEPSRSQGTGYNNIYHKFGVFGNLGGSTYFMTSINETIDLGNRNATTKTPNIYGGFNLDSGVQFGLTDRLLLGLDMAFLFAGTSRKSTDRMLVGYTYYGTPIYSDVTTESTMDIPAFVIGPTFKYAMPMGQKMLMTFGGGLDFVSVNGTGKYTQSSSAGTITSDNKYTGSGFGLRLLVGGEYFLTPMLALGADCGFRYAYVGQLNDKDGRKIQYTTDGGTLKDLTADYSGLFIKGGVRLYF